MGPAESGPATLQRKDDKVSAARSDNPEGSEDPQPHNPEVARHLLRLASALERAGVRETSQPFDALSLNKYIHPGLLGALTQAKVTFTPLETVPALLEIFAASQAKLSGVAHILRTRFNHVDHLADILDAEAESLSGATRDAGTLFGYDFQYIRSKVEYDEGGGAS